MKKRASKMGLIALFVVGSLLFANLAFAACATTPGQVCGDKKSGCGCSCCCCK